ncbi:MAG TPA: hypothetical protein VE046_10795 [Steroidobacteraceae bacterium]|nr:hypothetical protein [Steroidobacteraceae bacterium]
MIARVLLIAVLGVACASSAAASEYSKVNGSVQVGAGRQVTDDVSTVNGSVTIGEGASVEEASTVNGSITLGPRATAKEMNAVNGRLTLDESSSVSGAVSNVNGDIQLAAAHIGGGIHTNNGDVNVGANSHVEGGITVEKSSGGWFSWQGSPPRIVIGPGAVVDGPLRFERDVKLYVSDRAKIGAVTGATPVTYSGDTAPK